MHTNHRRKPGRHKSGNRYGVHLAVYRRIFWEEYRARERHLLVNERFDEVLDRIPNSIMWDAL